MQEKKRKVKRKGGRGEKEGGKKEGEEERKEVSVLIYLEHTSKYNFKEITGLEHHYLGLKTNTAALRCLS